MPEKLQVGDQVFTISTKGLGTYQRVEPTPWLVVSAGDEWLFVRAGKDSPGWDAERDCEQTNKLLDERGGFAFLRRADIFTALTVTAGVEAADDKRAREAQERRDREATAEWQRQKGAVRNR